MDDSTLKRALVDFLADVLIEASAKFGNLVEGHLKEVLEKERRLVIHAREGTAPRTAEERPARGDQDPIGEGLWSIEEFAHFMKFPTTDAARRFVRAHLPPDCRALGVGRRVKLIPSRVKRVLGLPS